MPPNLAINALSALVLTIRACIDNGGRTPVDCYLPLLRLSVTLTSPFITVPDAAFQPAAALCERKVNDYLLLFNGLTY